MAKKKKPSKKPGFRPKLPPEFEKLTTKQQAFVHHYLLNGGIGSDAARSAGYSGDDVTLAAMAYENLRHPVISHQIRTRQHEVCKKFDVKYEALIQELAAIAFFDIRDVMSSNTVRGIDIKEWREIPRHASKVIHSIRETQSEFGTNRSITAYDKVRAIQLLLKHARSEDGRTSGKAARAALLQRVQELFSKPAIGDGGGAGSDSGGSAT